MWLETLVPSEQPSRGLRWDSSYVSSRYPAKSAHHYSSHAYISMLVIYDCCSSSLDLVDTSLRPGLEILTVWSVSFSSLRPSRFFPNESKGIQHKLWILTRKVVSKVFSLMYLLAFLQRGEIDRGGRGGEGLCCDLSSAQEKNDANVVVAAPWRRRWWMWLTWLDL